MVLTANSLNWSLSSPQAEGRGWGGKVILSRSQQQVVWVNY